MSSFNALRKIRAAPPGLLEMDRRQLFDDFGRTLWVAYKQALLPAAVEAVGFDIGFPFLRMMRISKKASPCSEQPTPEPAVPWSFGQFLEQQRERWQNRFSAWRNKMP